MIDQPVTNILAIISINDQAVTNILAIISINDQPVQNILAIIIINDQFVTNIVTGLGEKKCTELEKMYRENQPKMYRDCKYFSRVFGIWRKTPRFQRCKFSGEILTLAFYLHAEQNKNGFPPISIFFFTLGGNGKGECNTKQLHCTYIYTNT